MAKFCCAIRPPCGAFLCRDKELTPDMALAVVSSFASQGGPIVPHAHFVIQLDRFPTKNTGHSLINKAVVLKNNLLYFVMQTVIY